MKAKAKNRKPKQKNKEPRKPRELLLPGQFHTGPSSVVAGLKIEEGGALAGCRKYHVETWRTDGRWSAELQWIETGGEKDREPKARVVYLPHEVLERLVDQRERILKTSRKIGAHKAHLTATAKARESEQQQELGNN